MRKLTLNIDNAINFSKGAIWGALLGDATGAYLEFMGRKPMLSDVDEALSMPGGGCWRTAPGQITDDGEMTIALARTLAEQGRFDIAAVARAYRRWILSDPFDVGNATIKALGKGALDDPNLHQKCISNAQQWNDSSKANGCLMRATPLGVWGIHSEQDEVIAAAKADCQLTHPNETCLVATAAYAVAIRHLIMNPGDRAGAFDVASRVAQDEGNEEVGRFMKDARSGNLPPYHPQAGYLGIAFTHAFHHLIHGSDYLPAMRTVLFGGGDTDTNACIVGGLIGAATGFENLPASLLRAVTECDVSLGQPRPEWLQTRCFVGVVERIVALERNFL